MDSKHVNIQMESKAPKAKVLSEAEKKSATYAYFCLY